MDFHKDDWDADASGKTLQVMSYPLLTFVRAIFEEFSGETLGSADDEGSDEAAVDDASGFAEYYIKLGILLVEDIYGADGHLLRNQCFNGLFVTVKGDAEDGGVPLLAKVIGHLGNDEGFAHFISGVDTLDTTFFVTRDLIDEFCHIDSFSAKITEASAEIRQKLFFFKTILQHFQVTMDVVDDVEGEDGEFIYLHLRTSYSVPKDNLLIQDSFVLLKDPTFGNKS